MCRLRFSRIICRLWVHVAFVDGITCMCVSCAHARADPFIRAQKMNCMWIWLPHDSHAHDAAAAAARRNPLGFRAEVECCRLVTWQRNGSRACMSALFWRKINADMDGVLDWEMRDGNAMPSFEIQTIAARICAKGGVQEQWKLNARKSHRRIHAIHNYSSHVRTIVAHSYKYKFYYERMSHCTRLDRRKRHQIIIIIHCAEPNTILCNFWSMFVLCSARKQTN